MCLLLLIGVLVAAILATGDINQIWMFYTADCRDNSITTVNVGLHLLLNAVSTVIFASSNFFMQVLNSPSRKEVDAVHAKGDWLDIGIPSWRNAFRLSWFKAIAWLTIFLTSLPIHLVFNSSMFQVNTLMGDFNVTIAAESFIKDNSVFFLPGASLETSDRRTSQLEDDRLSFQDYYDGKYASQLENVLKPAKNAQDWEKLEPAECVSMYAPRECSGLRDYRDVVVIVKGNGWKRSELWNLTGDELWESVVPRNELNSVWYTKPCRMQGMLMHAEPLCVGVCTYEFPYQTDLQQWVLPVSWRFPQYHANKSSIPWNITLFSVPGNDSSFGFRFDSPSLETRNGDQYLEAVYCLAEPRETTCAVAISKPLLLAVILSVLLKVVTCITVIRVLGPEESLVTPGDAICSFISVPESKPYESGPVTQDHIRKKARRKQHTPAQGVKLNVGETRSVLVVPKLTFLAFKRGQQTSTYRLQLPYRYSSPLLLMSTLLHWLVSTALFVIVTRGDKIGTDARYLTDTITLPDDATVSIGTSSLPVLILTILAAIMTLMPIAMAWVKLPGYMPVVGSNSRAMLAASRPSPAAKIPEIPGLDSDNTEGIELEQLIPASKCGSGEAASLVVPKSMAYCLLKWGEVEMPEDWYCRFDEASDGHPGLRVRHLSFGTIFDDPKPPTEGYLYA
ncbi:hypothetical protein CMUS01_12487 [Colletotrichum musicola]|uniref:DUF6536 domain-containing protein n=1 Tax=Colletotrichum musicola TaxID=2175873 RepID=A0A8H6JL06_9PEZI|nr:hypothetical protein CMUS01_12487 [Colletotrichum musicola]